MLTDHENNEKDLEDKDICHFVLTEMALLK